MKLMEAGRELDGSGGRRYVVVVDDESCSVDSNKTHDDIKEGGGESGNGRRGKQTEVFRLLFNLDRVRGWSIASFLSFFLPFFASETSKEETKEKEPPDHPR